MDAYALERLISTDADFAVMGFHDATVWSMTADTDAFEFLVDLDYLFKWVCPDETGYFKFWVAPVTMVFEGAMGVKVHLESQQGLFEVSDLRQENPRLTPNGKATEHDYGIECQEGEIELSVTGFKMFVRRRPQLIRGQRLDLAQRGEVGFGRELTGPRRRRRSGSRAAWQRTPWGWMTPGGGWGAATHLFWMRSGPNKD